MPCRATSTAAAVGEAAGRPTTVTETSRPMTWASATTLQAPALTLKNCSLYFTLLLNFKLKASLLLNFKLLALKLN